MLVDEAYADFSGRTMIGPRLDRHRNLVVGRTFAKAHGLAGLRIGALVGHPDTIAPIRCAPAAVRRERLAAARARRGAGRQGRHRAVGRRRRRVESSCIYDWCRSRGLTYWPSEANFVLVRFGPAVSAIVQAMAERGMLIRDRSAAPGCDGCARIAPRDASSTHARVPGGARRRAAGPCAARCRHAGDPGIEQERIQAMGCDHTDNRRREPSPRCPGRHRRMPAASIPLLRVLALRNLSRGGFAIETDIKVLPGLQMSFEFQTRDGSHRPRARDGRALPPGRATPPQPRERLALLDAGQPLAAVQDLVDILMDEGGNRDDAATI